LNARWRWAIRRMSSHSGIRPMKVNARLLSINRIHQRMPLRYFLSVDCIRTWDAYHLRYGGEDLIIDSKYLDGTVILQREVRVLAIKTFEARSFAGEDV
jgi:hypothetical protein